MSYLINWNWNLFFFCFDFKKLVLADTNQCIRIGVLVTLVLIQQPLIYPLTNRNTHTPTNTFYHPSSTHSCAMQFDAFQPNEVNIYKTFGKVQKVIWLYNIHIFVIYSIIMEKRKENCGVNHTRFGSYL